MIATCTKCHQLYEAAETEPLLPDHACPRCAAVDELLAAADALNSEVALKLAVGKIRHGVGLGPTLERSRKAVERARAT